MAFIPIDAKADIQGGKKGKLTPAQHAQLNAWCLAEKTGILDCLGKCESSSSSYTATNNIATVIFKKGYIVICGRLIECEEGTELNIETPTIGSTIGKIIIRCNLSSTKEEEFVVTTKVGTLIQQDLNSNPITGVYEFELYSYEATPNSVVLKERTTPYVPDIGGKLNQFEKSLTDEGKPLGGYDTNKGTIEERLTRLGFKEDSVVFDSELKVNNTVQNKITRQGNYCLLNLDIKFSYKKNPKEIKIGVVPDEFKPKEEIKCWGAIEFLADALHSTFQTRAETRCLCHIDTKGNIIIDYFDFGKYDYNNGDFQCLVDEFSAFSLGYEAPPIN